MINASPDLRSQINAFAPLHPRPGKARNSPIEGLLLTNADLDHVLGTFLLREGDRLSVHATPSVQHSLGWLDRVLAPYCGIEWHQPKESLTPLLTKTKVPSGMSYRFIGLPGSAPRYDKQPAQEEGHSIALEMVDDQSGRKLLVAPDVAQITPALDAAMEKADAILFDGTFWSEDELRAICPEAPLAAKMGHLPISGGSLDVLRRYPAVHKIYVHINNTNPILSPESKERAIVESAGLTVGRDGLQFNL